MTRDADATASILFICTANRVRSPFAEAVGRTLADRAGLPVELDSAGFLAGGHPAEPDMVHVARRRGIDLSTHVSRRVDAELISHRDVVVAMTGQHVIDLVGIAPDAAERILTLRELAAAARHVPIDSWAPDDLRRWAAGPAQRPIQQLLDGRNDIDDPVGRSMRHHRSTADEIAALLESVLTEH